MSSALSSPVVVDGIVSDEKLSELLGLQAEYPELDYKRFVDPGVTRSAVELAKDVGAMQVRGGYIVVGVDGQGAPTGEVDDVDLRRFDEANLVPKLRRWLPEPLSLRTRVADRKGHKVIVIFVGPHPSGLAFTTADGSYQRDDGEEVVVFRFGEVFWRDGTRSARMDQRGIETVIEQRIQREKESWLVEQEGIRRRERAELETAREGRRAVEAPLGSVNLDMSAGELTAAALEFVRHDDSIGLRRLLNDAVDRARALIDRDEIEVELGDLLDKLTCLAATFLEYDEREWFDRVVALLANIYSLPVGEGDAQRLAYATSIPPTTRAPRVWLEIVRRVYGLGALAVRRRQWTAVRTLTVEHPEGFSDYDAYWLRHALTMASRAQHLYEQRDDRTVELSLLSLARSDIERLACLRSDGLAGEDEAILSSLAQFDLLTNLVAVVDYGRPHPGAFYPNFARFGQQRVDPIVDRLLCDTAMRGVLGLESDTDFAVALGVVGEGARNEGFRYGGFFGWAPGSAVANFVTSNYPTD
jgi:hypothetical protein